MVPRSSAGEGGRRAGRQHLESDVFSVDNIGDSGFVIPFTVILSWW